jgi:transketolase
MSDVRTPQVQRERVHADALLAYGERHPEAVVLSADLTASTEADGFRDAYPERFFSVGMAEQNMLGIAGGLAREGCLPLVHDFSVFLYRRALDQLQMSIAYPNLRVRLLGFLPGLTTPGGVTHQAIDDLAVLRAVPNLTIVECGDAREVAEVLEAVHDVDGPVYLRMLRGRLPVLFDTPLRLGEDRDLGGAGDVLLISTGSCTLEALAARELLAQHGVEVAHRHVSTIKPFGTPALRAALTRARHVVTVENHLVTGGLGSAVAEVLAEVGGGPPLMRLGVRDVYAHGATQATLFAEHGIDAAAIAAALGRLVGIDIAPVVDADERAAAIGTGRDEAL